MTARTHGPSALGEFLSSRRAQLTPAAVGLPDYGDQRRVPGLRREEVAQLAGVSVAYYTRLERGASLNASVQVLDALATALGLEDAERRHLHGLSGDGRQQTRRRRPAAEHVTAPMRQLMDTFGDAPAILLGRRSDVLAWNRTGHALFAGHLDPDSPDRPGGPTRRSWSSSTPTPASSTTPTGPGRPGTSSANCGRRSARIPTTRSWPP
jgi:transcriptional regulator with XRE-family HTH domain